MASKNAMNINDEPIKFPQCLGDIVKFVVSNFYTMEHLKLIEVLLSRPLRIFTEQELTDSLHFNIKNMRTLANALRQEKIINIKVKNIPNPNNQEYMIKINTYNIDYATMLNVIRYKIICMHQEIHKSEESHVRRSHLMCKICFKEYSDYEISQIIDIKTGLLQCYICEGEVDEIDDCNKFSNNGPNSGLMTKFNQQMKPLFDLVQTCESINVESLMMKVGDPKYEDFKIQNLTASEESYLPMNAQILEEKRKTFVKSENNVEEEKVTFDFNVSLNQSTTTSGSSVPDWLKDSYRDKNEQQTLNKVSKISGVNEDDIRDLVGKESSEISSNVGLIEQNDEIQTMNNEKEVPKIEINGYYYKLDEIPENIIEEMDEETEKKYLELCEKYY